MVEAALVKNNLDNVWKSKYLPVQGDMFYRRFPIESSN